MNEIKEEMKIQVREREGLINVPSEDAHVAIETSALEEIDIDIAAMTVAETLVLSSVALL